MVTRGGASAKQAYLARAWGEVRLNISPIPAWDGSERARPPPPYERCRPGHGRLAGTQTPTAPLFSLPPPLGVGALGLSPV